MTRNDLASGGLEIAEDPRIDRTAMSPLLKSRSILNKRGHF